MSENRWVGYLSLWFVGLVAALVMAAGAVTLGTGLGLAGVVRGADNNAYGFVYPRFIFPPAILGTARSGATLTVRHGLYLHHPTEYFEQWYRCRTATGACQAILGATGTTYTMTAADVGLRIRVQEIAANAYGRSSPVLSRPTARVRAF